MLIEDDLWKKVRGQEEKYGTIDTPEIEWGEDIGTEIIEELCSDYLKK